MTDIERKDEAEEMRLAGIASNQQRIKRAAALVTCTQFGYGMPVKCTPVGCCYWQCDDVRRTLGGAAIEAGEGK
jgi:hypothetical protein